MKDIISQHQMPGVPFLQALSQPLGFLIPATQEVVDQFPGEFSYGYSDISSEVEYWLNHRLVGDTETTVTSLNQSWLGIIQALGAVCVYQNATHASSKRLLRPDTTGVKEGAGILVFKEEAKDKSSSLSVACKELTEKMHPDAYKTYPFGLTSIPGFATCNNAIQLYSIDFNPYDNSYSTKLVSMYNVQDLGGRVSFLVDVFKLIKWIAGLSRPNESIHLIPGVRLQTSNDHFITWTSTGLLKEFSRARQGSIRYDLITRVYDAKLPHVEQGTCNCTSVTIQTIGRRAREALQAKLIQRAELIAQVRSALNSLHDIGIAHCDVCLENVFVLDSGVVILGDLEYCTEANGQPPSDIRRRFDRELGVPSSASDLDDQQFAKLCEEL